MQTVINLNEVVMAEKIEHKNGLTNWFFGMPEYSIILRMSNGRYIELRYEYIDYDKYCSDWNYIINSIENKLTINT